MAYFPIFKSQISDISRDIISQRLNPKGIRRPRRKITTGSKTPVFFNHLNGYKSSKNIGSASYSPFTDTGSILSKTQKRYFKTVKVKESMESIPPAYVAWRAGTTTIFLLGS
jgi:hypothetical protein